MSSWLDSSVFYEIYPQSFNDTNADGIGDIPGIIAKLGYIAELGCNAIWLNPCFMSPFGDAGYDVSDYLQVAPRYGTNEDLKRLFDEAHARDMHVLLDLVPGHTSVEHPWFKRSCSAVSNEFSGRYIWTDDVWAPVGDVSGINGVVRGIAERNGAVAVNFFSFQPALNYGFARVTESWQSPIDAPECLATRQAIKDVMAFWLELGADGFRVDMAGSLVKDDPGQEETIKLWRDMRGYLDEHFPEAVLISEWGEPDKTLRAGFHMDFLLQFGTSHYTDLTRCEHPYFSREGRGDASRFVETYRDNIGRTGGRGLMCIPSGNHDMQRLRRYLDPEEMKRYFAFMLSMPGAPFVYYGDEIGMRQLSVVSVEGGYERTGARSPMQWERGANFGFSSAPRERLYIPQDAAADAPVVRDQMKDPDSLWSEVHRLIELRRTTPALQATSPVEFAYCEPGAYPLVYVRGEGVRRVLVAINPSGGQASCPCGLGPGRLLYAQGAPARLGDGVLSMAPESVSFIELP